MCGNVARSTYPRHTSLRFEMYHPPRHSRTLQKHQEQQTNIRNMKQLLTFCAASILICMLASCHTHKKTSAFSHKIEIDTTIFSFDRVVQSQIQHQFRTIHIKEYDIFNDSIVNEHHKEITIQTKDTICSEKTDSSKFALQSHQIDSVVQVSTLTITSEHSASKQGFWASFKTLCTLLVLCCIVLGVVKVWKKFF